MTIWNILLIFVLISINAFFTATEFAVVASRRARLDMLVDNEDPTGRIVRGWLENPSARDRLIAATQLGITAVSLALGAAGENAFEAALGPYFRSAAFPPALQVLDVILPFLPLFFSLLVVTSLHVVLGEQVPKVAVLRSPEQFALAAAPAMRIFLGVFRWFVTALDLATRTVLRLFGVKASSVHSILYTVEEIKEMVSGPEVEGVLEEPERQMLRDVLDFGNLIVRQVALPRTEILAVEVSTSIEELTQLAIDRSVTKIPVYDGSLDKMVGIVHVRDILAAMASGQAAGKTARDLAREALFVPETISVNDLLREFRARRQHMAIVLDEYGGTAGLVTLEDLMEEIVGEVRGPFEPRPAALQPQPDGSTLVDGLVLIEEFNQHFGLSLHDPNYDTIAGYVLGCLGRIPREGDTVEDTENGILLKVTSMDRLRVAQVAVRHL